VLFISVAQLDYKLANT